MSWSRNSERYKRLDSDHKICSHFSLQEATEWGQTRERKRFFEIDLHLTLFFIYYTSLFLYFTHLFSISMPKDDKIEVEGKVLKSLPWAIFEVELPEAFSNMVIRAYVGGKMQKNRIQLIPGDTVTIELTPYDLTRGRITFRKPNANAPVYVPKNKR